MNAQEIIEAVGEEWAMDRFQVGRAAVRHHVKHGQLPAMWYAALCQKTGQTLPVSAFSFKGLVE